MSKTHQLLEYLLVKRFGYPQQLCPNGCHEARMVEAIIDELHREDLDNHRPDWDPDLQAMYQITEGSSNE